MKFTKLNYTEPAVLRGIVTAIVALLLSVGVTIPSEWNDIANQLIAGIALIAPIVGGIWTRRAVTSPATVKDLEAMWEASLPDADETITPEDEAAALADLPEGAGAHGEDV